MGFFRSLNGSVEIEIVSADIAGLLTCASQRNIPLDKLHSVDDMTVRVSVSRANYKRLFTLANRRGSKVRIVKKKGLYWHGKTISKRPIFLIGLVILLFLALFLPSRILFVRVKGNHMIPSKMILEQANECGIKMFASRRKVRSEKVKNALLERIPELQWVGVNTAGCVATISVSEKAVSDPAEQPFGKISSIVAARDGIIYECTVLKGNQLCRVGQAVKKGETLISGYTDCGLTIQATQAEGEIFARTLRVLEMITPINSSVRGKIKSQKTNFSLLFGKKVIKLYNGSGISDTSCVKIYNEMLLTLPGGFHLPVSLIRENIIDYEFTDKEEVNDLDWLSKEAEQYLHSQMIAGQIVNQEIQMEALDQVYCLTGRFSCLEMIGKVKNEDMIQR